MPLSPQTLSLDPMASFKRTTTKAWMGLALLQCFASASWALDWGHPLMMSKQGEPLKIDIPLSMTSPEEAKGLVVNLAPTSAYQSRHLTDEGIALSAIGAQAKLAQNAKGMDVISINSDKPYNQSFISLLIQLQWSTGSETKEMGLLLERPGLAKALDENTIVVTEGDTASSLAQQYAQSPVSYEQMLLALLKANPKSFVNQNINRLRADATLKLPSQAQALSLTPQEAKKEVKLQNLEFEQYRQSLAQKIARSQASSIRATPQSASGQISPKVQGPGASNLDQLKLSKPGSKSAKASDQTAKELQAKDALHESDQIKQNLKELGQVADESAKSSGSGTTTSALFSVDVPSLKVRISSWLQKPLTPVIAGLLFGFLVLLTLWKTRHQDPSKTQEGDGLDPLSRPSSIFDLETPIPSHLRAQPTPLRSLGEQTTGTLSAKESTEELPPEELNEEPGDTMSASMQDPHTSGSLKDHVKIDFDLDLPDDEEPKSVLTPFADPSADPSAEPMASPAQDSTAALEEHSLAQANDQSTAPIPSPMATQSAAPNDTENPLQVRFDLAQELWQVGQQHTARAIVEEVVRQATGELLEQSQAWLNARQ